MNNNISPQVMHKLMVMKACISGLADFHKNQKGIFHNAWELASFAGVEWGELLSFSFKATDCHLTHENIGLIEPGSSILLSFIVFVDGILKCQVWVNKNTHNIVCLFQWRIPQEMGLMNCFQGSVVCVTLDLGDKDSRLH